MGLVAAWRRPAARSGRRDRRLRWYGYLHIRSHDRGLGDDHYRRNVSRYDNDDGRLDYHL